MRVLVADIVATYRAVEVPTRCPNPECEADLTDELAIVEENMSETQFQGALSPDGFVPEKETYPSCAENYFASGYRCRTCSTAIAEGSVRSVVAPVENSEATQ